MDTFEATHLQTEHPPAATIDADVATPESEAVPTLGGLSDVLSQNGHEHTSGLRWLTDIPPDIRKLIYQEYIETKWLKVTRQESNVEPEHVAIYRIRALLEVCEEVAQEVQKLVSRQITLVVADSDATDEVRSGHKKPEQAILSDAVPLLRLGFHKLALDSHTPIAMLNFIRIRCIVAGARFQEVCIYKAQQSPAEVIDFEKRHYWRWHPSPEICSMPNPFLGTFLKFGLEVGETVKCRIANTSNISSGMACEVNIGPSQTVQVRGLREAWARDVLNTLSKHLIWPEGLQIELS